MKIPGAQSWIRLVLCYWLVMIVIVFLEINNMNSDWAGLPGFLLSLPLSALVVTGYLVSSYLSEVHGYKIHLTDYHVEYGFLICAFLNGLIFYPLYWWLRRVGPRALDSIPPPMSQFGSEND